MPVSLKKWNTTAQDRDFRNNTNENWTTIEQSINDLNAPGNVTSEKVAPEAIDDYHLKFTPLFGIKGKNLFNKSRVALNSILSGTTGQIQSNPYPEYDFCVSDFISVESVTTYSKLTGDTTCFYDTNKNYINGVTTKTFTTPSNAKFLRFVTRASLLFKEQLEKGAVNTEYEGYGNLVDSKSLQKKSIGPEYLKEQYLIGSLGKNLFNKSTVTLGMYVSYSTGSLVAGAGFTASDYIEVKSNVIYSKKENQQLAFYDTNKKYISGLASATTFTTPTNAKYVRLTTEEAKLSMQQLEEGSVSTAYEPFLLGLSPELIRNKSIGPEALKESYLPGSVGKNLFNKDTVVSGYYVSALDGKLVAGIGFSASDYIEIEPNTDYTVYAKQQAAFYDVNKVFVSGVINVNTFKSPVNAKYIRITTPDASLNLQQLEKGTTSTSYEPFGSYLPANKVLGLEAAVNPDKFSLKLQLPSFIYVVAGESFSVYYNNIIFKSQIFRTGTYYIRGQRLKDDGTYEARGRGYSYKWEYTPTNAETSFKMEFQLVETYSQTVIDKKVIEFRVTNPSTTNARSKTSVIIGDSFTDGYKVSKFLHDFVTKDGKTTLNAIGLHDSAKSGVKDDAWSGYGYSFYNKVATGYLRSDRPLSDAVWDAGWGKDEPNGWKDGQTYNDLTPEQRSHGFTKNQFYNPTTKKFDFSYYINTYFPSYVPHSQEGNHIDTFISFAGLNDAIWRTVSQTKAQLESDKQNILDIVNSVLAWDPSVKIILHTVTPQPIGDEYLGGFGIDFKHYERAKYNQELWNDMVLTTFDTQAWRNKGLIVLPTSAHFDTRFSLLTETVNPDKFNPAYIETVTKDIHPNDTGAKYIADAAYFALYNVIHS